MLFNEPKLLKSNRNRSADKGGAGFSALQRAEIAEIESRRALAHKRYAVSVLFNEPKLLKYRSVRADGTSPIVSVLFNEPKLLKFIYDIQRYRYY